MSAADLIDRVHQWQNLTPPKSRWARRSRATMTTALRGVRDEIFSMSVDDVIKHVNAAYPFGQRSHHPYKRWREELRLLREYLSGPVEDPNSPTAEDYGAVLVATDLVEQRETARALLLMQEQAPRRHNRKCPTCGRKAGQKCRDLNTGEVLVVPHLSRVEPPNNGPLFTAPLLGGPTR